MPRQNRITPFGEVVAVAERGTLMGNRGLLHAEDGRIVRPWQVRRWLVCRLEFKGWKRAVMTPGRYTELFFLDEATGLAAGHRPCAVCLRERFNAFRDAWVRGGAGGEAPSVADIDGQLHAERVAPGRSKRVFAADLGALPDGVFVTRQGRGEVACLVWGGFLLDWSPGGYRGRVRRPSGEQVLVLTPRSTVAAIRAGYVPEVHPSAGP
jgi:hypothetical protein